ncbi:MAG: hypothetical protein E7631_07530 [Ruminococcaceae bacterium]|nr:hypothetical protein [Oscillospiraceae bacterium]
MKHNILAVLLAALMLTPALASCGGGETETTADTAVQGDTVSGDAEADLFAAYRGIDLGGRSVRISVSSNISENGGGMPTSYPYIAGPEEMTGESVQDSVFQRNMEVEEMLNCTLEHEALDLNFDQVQPHIESLVMSGDAAVDYYVNDQLGLLHCGLKGYLLDLADKSMFGEYYFDLDSDVYYSEYMQQLSVGDKRFIITGDYFIDTMRAAHVLYLNKNIVTELYGDSNYVYNLVLDDDWTLAKMNEMITEAYQDTNGDGTPDENDIYGLTGHSSGWAFPYYAFYYSTDCKVVSFDDKGLPYINENSQEALSKMAEYLITTDTSIGIWKTTTVADSLKKFVNGQAMLTFFQKVGDMEQSSIRDFDGMGVIPYPKMDDNQAIYRTLVHDTAEMGAVPITTVGEAATAVSAVIQVLSTHAHEYLLEGYYEVALKSKYAQDAYTAQMLDIVVAGISAPFEFAYELGFGTDSFLNTITFQPIADSITKGTDVTASTFATLLPAAQTRLQELTAIYTEN